MCAPRYDFRTLLTYRVLVLSNTLGVGAVRLYARQFGIPLAEWRLLAALAICAPASVNRLAAALNTDKGWISRTAAALVAKGLAQTRTDSGDARRTQIVLSAAGRAIYKRILPAAIERQDRLVSVMSAAEQVIFDELLERLQRQAQILAGPTVPEKRSAAKAAGKKTETATK